MTYLRTTSDGHRYSEIHRRYRCRYLNEIVAALVATAAILKYSGATATAKM